MWGKYFGGGLTEEWVDRYRRSPQWQNGRFVNPNYAQVAIPIGNVSEPLRGRVGTPSGRRPKQPLPIASLDKDLFLTPSSVAKVVWYGHSASLLRMEGKTMLIDPMLGGSPVPWFPLIARRFSHHVARLIRDLPFIDLVLITHDHYDHLDLASIGQLRSKVGRYLVALGVGRHLIRWGIDPAQIEEFDWWDEGCFDGLRITFTPTQHFSGRGFRDRNRSLWGGWSVASSHERIYCSGDGGYGPHFKMIGKRLGPFDFGLMECGQYNARWHPIHLFPEESVQAALDAGVGRALAVHWGAFSLAFHGWKEPIERFVEAADSVGLPVATPTLGELFTIDQPIRNRWWDNFE